VRLVLPEGEYQMACYDPKTGLYSPRLPIWGDPAGVWLALPEFVHDLVVRITRQSGPAQTA